MQRQRNPTALERLSVGIDRVIGVFAPGWAARRAMNRLEYASDISLRKRTYVAQ